MIPLSLSTAGERLVELAAKVMTQQWRRVVLRVSEAAVNGRRVFVGFDGAVLRRQLAAGVAD